MQNKPFSSSKSTVLSTLMVLFSIAVLIMLALRHASPPPVTAEHISSRLFSAERALSHLRMFAQKAHPVGSPEHEQVQNYLLSALRALGLNPQLQTTLAISRSKHSPTIGIVNNILVRIPGREHDKALMLSAHYDSVPTGPGAADDGASVAAILETLRAMQNQPPLKTDVICIFSDGEEAGLLGAEAFVAEHPWAKDVGLVLNFEYRGNRGPLLMFETSSNNGNLITGFANAAAHALANSAMYEVYRHMPNDTDFSVFKRAGMPGLNFAAIEGDTSYHSALDRPELLQVASLQHEGDTMLALLNYFGNTPLATLAAADKVYFDLPGLGLIHYPISWVQPLNAVLVLLFAGVCTLGIKVNALRPVRTLLAALYFLLCVPMLAGICQLLWLSIQKIHSDYHQALPWNTYNSHWYLLAFTLLVTGLFALLQVFMHRWLRTLELTIGALSCWLLLLLIAGMYFPGAGFLLTWPMAAMLISCAVYFNQSIASLRYAALMLLGASPGILLFTPLIKTLYIGLTPQLVGVVMISLVLLLGLCAPLLAILSWRLIVPKLLLAGAGGFLLIGSITSTFNESQPRPNNIMYALAGNTGKSFWLSFDQQLDDWTGTFFPNVVTKRRVPAIFGHKNSSLWAASAPTFAIAAPTVQLLADTSSGDNRTLKLQVQSPRRARLLGLAIEDATVLSAIVQGKSIPIFNPQEWRLNAVGMPADGFNIELTVKAGLPFSIRVFDQSSGLPPLGWPARPAHMISGQNPGDLTMAVNWRSFQ